MQVQRKAFSESANQLQSHRWVSPDARNDWSENAVKVERSVVYDRLRIGDDDKREESVPGFPTAPVMARYRCFLPDLAGLAGSRRVGPGTD